MFKAFLLLLSLLLGAAPAFAGTVQGTVQFTGSPPPPTIHKTGKYAKACGAEIAGETLVLNKQNVKNVVVWLVADKGSDLKGQPAATEFKLDQKKCRYEPHVVAMSKGTELNIYSSDPINHNIHTYSFDNDPINLMFVPGQEHIQEFEETEIVKVECDLHSWMQAWVVVTPNPYFAVTTESGAYEIRNIPAGTYTLKVWHELLGTQSREIEIGEDTLEIDFGFTELAEQVSQN